MAWLVFWNDGSFWLYRSKRKAFDKLKELANETFADWCLDKTEEGATLIINDWCSNDDASNTSIDGKQFGVRYLKCE